MGVVDISQVDPNDITQAPGDVAEPQRTPPPGLRHAAYRAFESTMANLDQFASNVASIPAKLPNTPNFKKFSKDAGDEAARRRKELAEDTAGEPQTTGEKLTEGVGKVAGASIPYLAGGGPAGAAAVGTLENLDKGPWEAIKGGVKAAAFAKAGEVLGPVASKIASKVAPSLPASVTKAVTTASNATPAVVKRAAAGGATAATLAAVGGGNTEDVESAALVGAAGRVRKPVPFGPKPKGELRETIPPNTSKWEERLMRVAAPGKYTPNQFKRVALLQASIPNADPETIVHVLPELDKTIKESGVIPKGVAKTEGVIERPGEGVLDHETVNSLLGKTMGRLEQRYQDVLRPNAQAQIFMDPIADAVNNQKTAGLVNFDAANPSGKSDVSKFVSRLTEVENAFRGKSLSLGDLDDLRQYYYNSRKSGEAGRSAERSNADVVADQAVEDALRKIVYDNLETLAQQQGKDPKEIRDIKSKQRSLYSLMDAGKSSSADFLSEAAVKRGYDTLQKMNVTSAIHPGSLTPVMSVHGLVKGFAGEPKDLKSAEKRVRKAFPEKGVPNSKVGQVAQATGRAVGAVAQTAATKGVVGQVAQGKREEPLYMAPGQSEGMVKPGNIDLKKLPVVNNGDGSYSTVYSTSFLDEKPDSPNYGKEVLVRGIINGKKTDDVNALRKKYYQDGQTLGVFENGEAADKYGQRLHEDWANGKIKGVQMSNRQQQPPAAPATVKMRAPDGSTRDVPASEMEHWKQKGATVVQ